MAGPYPRPWGGVWAILHTWLRLPPPPTSWIRGGSRRTGTTAGASARPTCTRASGGVPLLLVHGWPETKRIWWRVIEPLAAAGFEVIAPDLRNFGESEVAPDGFGDVASSSHDLHALVHDHLGHDRVVLVGGDFGGPIIQDMALRFGGFVDRMVLFNSPLPYDKERMAGLRTRPNSAHDYFLRQGTDADALAAELATPEQRRRYIATFYSSRFWAHPGAFDDATIAFHTEPFADGAKLPRLVRGLRERRSRGRRHERAGHDRAATPTPAR